MVVAGPFPTLAESDVAAKAFPPVLERAGRVACFAADEFFSARISNPETRRAYARAVGWFLEFCEREGLELARVTPRLAGRFLRDLPVSAATKNIAWVVRDAVTKYLDGRTPLFARRARGEEP